MATEPISKEPITIEVDAAVARAFKNATPDEQQQFAQLFSKQILEALEHAAKVQKLLATMRQTAQEAQANGLTEERLQEILQELDEEGFVRAGTLRQHPDTDASAVLAGSWVERVMKAKRYQLAPPRFHDAL